MRSTKGLHADGDFAGQALVFGLLVVRLGAGRFAVLFVAAVRFRWRYGFRRALSIRLQAWLRVR